MSRKQAEAQEDDPLGALHEAAAGVEPERLGLGPLVGDQCRHREHGERQHAAWAPLAEARYQATPPSSSAVGDPVGDRVEERAATRRGAGGLGDGAVEQVGHGGEDEEQKPATERAACDGDGGADGQ